LISQKQLYILTTFLLAQWVIMKKHLKIASLLATSLLMTACSSMFAEKSIIAEPTACECPDFTAPLSDTLVTMSEPKPCPVFKPVPQEAKSTEPLEIPVVQNAELLTIGQIENVTVDTLKLTFKAKMDSGALLSSINALDMKKFERDGKKWVRFAVLHPKTGQKVFYELPIVRTKVIKQLSGKYQERPVVSLMLSIGNIKEPVDVTLTDRTGYLYQLLIGRNFMHNRMLIQIGKTFIVK
jgi:hypothetical protein